jgi:hypothetical protein
MSMSHATSQLIASLADAYAILADDLPDPANGTGSGQAVAPTTLAECVPLLAIAMELIDRGPSALTIEGVEGYRTKVMQLLEHIRPVVESEATLTLANWTRLLAA